MTVLPPAAGASRLRPLTFGQELVIATAIAVGPLLLWWAFLSPSMEWGDDWAGYLLQAHALVAGDPSREVARNAEVVDASDVQFGPYAYPWTYPALLALVGPAVGWDWAALKVYGAVSLLILALGAYALARAFFGPGGSILLAVLATSQGPIVSSALRISSDLAFTAVSIAALALAAHALADERAGIRSRLRRAAVIAVACALAFTIRSNGIVLLVAYPAVLGAWAAARPQRRVGAVQEALVFGLVAVVLLTAYFAIVPDGSLFHMRLLSRDPRVWAGRLIDHARNLADFFPVDVLSGRWQLVVLVPLLASAVAAAAIHGRRALLLALYVAGHLVLLTLFPVDQGTRYYLPLVAPLAVLIALGAAALWARRGRIEGLSMPRRMWATCAGALIAGATAWAVVVVRQDVTTIDGQTGPASASTRALARFVETGIPIESRIAFRKPRALRYLTGRPAVAIALPERLDRIDVYLFDTEHLSFQVDQRALDEDVRFEVVYSGPPYRAYRRRSPR